MHYHVECDWLSDEGRVYVAEDIFAALSHLEYELSSASEFEYEGISANGENENYEEAYNCWVVSNQLNYVAGTAKNIVDQKFGVKPRAPLYASEQLTSAGRSGDVLLLETARCFLPDGKWGHDNSKHIFDDLPLRYTPYLWECHNEDCEDWQWQKEQDEG